MEISQVETPCLIVDEDKLDANIQRMAKAAATYGVQMRPHVKTHKIPAIAQRQIKAGAVGITVAKLAEAEVMARGGVTNIFIAFPIVTPSKLERAVQLSKTIDLILTVDSMEGAKLLSEAAGRAQQTINVRLEVDTGLRRTGVQYEEAVQLAAQIYGLPHLALTGISTYRGANYQGKPTRDLEAAGLEEGRLMVDLAEAMRSEGIPIVDVSVGSTPTAVYAAQVQGVTEIRPGTYVFQDRMQAELGVCTLDDCAAYVLATVVSRPSDDLAIIDGGSKTFATDIQPGAQPMMLTGFGYCIDAPDVLLGRMTEEHGMVQLDKTHTWKIGDRVAMIPNHICSTVNLHNQVYLMREGLLQKVTVDGRGMLN